MSDIINNFQFIRPVWLWALVGLVIVYAAKLKFGKHQNVWQQLIPEHLYKQMIVRKGVVTSNKFMHFTALAIMFAIIAAAGPSWEKLPQAVYQTQAGKVILMDMSMSMRATDLSPNRLTRSRFKAMDLLSEITEGETGLVAYAGDAFSVSPLTDDATNLRSLIPVLAPEIMPTKGSVALNGLSAAASLLEDAGYQQGQIYWITDGIRNDEIREVREFLSSSAFDVSALLIGTEAGAPIALLDGQLLKDFTGKIVVPSINSRYMNQAMSGTGAEFYIFANDNSDIQAMKRKVEFNQQQQSKEVENTTGDAFKDMGPYLLVLLLPVAAYSFRKGVLGVAFVSSVLLMSHLSVPVAHAYQTQALPNEALNSPAKSSAVDKSSKAASILDRVFKNADQRGKLAFDAQDYQGAAQLFEDMQWQAASAYKSADFERAEALYTELAKLPNAAAAQTKDNTYNKGNALAKQGKLEEALEAYNDVLNTNPEHAQAAKNKDIIELLLDQQQNEQEQQQNSENEDQNKDENSESSDDKNQDQQEDSESQSDSSQNNEQQSEDQEDSQQQSEQDSDQQNSQDSNSQDSDAQEQSDEALKQEAQEQKNQTEQERDTPEQQSQQQDLNQENTQEQPQDEQEQTAAISNQMNMDDLTPQQKEELKRMQMILNKIPDDPAYLLKRKMQLEAYKRQNNSSPPEQENW